MRAEGLGVRGWGLGNRQIIMARLRYKLTIAYDGSQFHGWQEQCPPDSQPLRTVQGVVRATCQQVLGQPLELVGASRTDTGVHAMGQVAHLDADTSIPVERMAMAITSRLPDDVEVRTVELAAPDFDAIRDARRKQYRYRIWACEHRPLQLRHCVYHCWVPLNVRAMNDAAMRLVGEHDFVSFANAAHGRLTTVRTIYDCHIEHAPDSPEIHIVVQGNGFLYNMVRIIAGTLFEVARGHRPPEYIDQLLATPDRQQAGPTLPPEGLVLEWIKY